MKAPRKNLTRIIAAVTTTGILAPSCEVFNYDDTVISENLPAKGSHAIELNLTQGELDYLLFLQKLSNDIVKYPIIAREFVQNPQLFLEKYGYNESIDLDEHNLKLILALGDEDINSAVNAGDITMVLKLLKDRNLLDELSKSNSYINIPEEQMKEALALMGVDAEDIECYLCVPGICGLGVIAVAVYIVAVGTFLWGVAVNWGYAETFSSNNSNDFLDQHSSLKIWGLKDKSNDTYIAVDQYIEGQINNIVDVVKSYNISFDENKMREFIKLNILM